MTSEHILIGATLLCVGIYALALVVRAALDRSAE